MKTQIDKNRLDLDRVRQEMRWEPWKAMAVAAGAGATLTLALIGIITALLKVLS